MTRSTKEFREQAKKLSEEIGVKKAAEQLGVPYNTLSEWRKTRTDPKKTGHGKDKNLTEREKELMKEIAELRASNEILKDALGFFVEDRKRKRQ